MLRTSLTIAFTALSTSAFAHAGHIANTGQGHSHFAILAAVGVIAIAATTALIQRFSS